MNTQENTQKDVRNDLNKFCIVSVEIQNDFKELTGSKVVIITEQQYKEYKHDITELLELYLKIDNETTFIYDWNICPIVGIADTKDESDKIDQFSTQLTNTVK
jgi:hypothetical protein